MAGPALPVNVDSAYADSTADASVKLHQQHHDAIHTQVNRFDTGTPKIGDQYVFSTTALAVPVPGTGISRWNPTTLVYEPARPSWAPFGWIFLSTNDGNAPDPVTAPSSNLANMKDGDIWWAADNAA